MGGLGWVGLVVLTFNQYHPPIRTLARDRFKWFIWNARPAFIALEVCWVVSCKALHGSSGRPQYFGLSTLAWACCYQGSTLQIFRRIHFTLGLFYYPNIYRVVFLTGPPDFQYQNEKNLLSQRGAFLH